VFGIVRRATGVGRDDIARAGRTRWGAIIDRRITASGFFRAERRSGVWWIVDPDGGRYLSKGVCNVSFDPDHMGES